MRCIIVVRTLRLQTENVCRNHLRTKYADIVAIVRVWRPISRWRRRRPRPRL